MAWYDAANFYHIYPLGLCGCPTENDGQLRNGFPILTRWADHAKELGCNAIFLGPVFQSGSHGYDTIDYRTVDCRLGTNADLRAFVEHCHANGQRVILDGVFNHVGRGFFAFQDVKEKREASPYCGWFCGLNFWGNNEYNDGFCYENWGGYNLLVKLNQQNPEVQQYHFDTIRFWVEEFDIDGLRLDAADVLDFGFMQNLRRFADGVKPEFWLMGEVIHGDYSRWANGEMLHSVTNYDLSKGLWSGHNDHNYFEIAHTVRRLQGMCGNIKLYTFVDNHDVARIASKVNNPAHLPLIEILVAALPGIPSVYYGSEFALKAEKQRDSDWNLRPALDLDALLADETAAAHANFIAKINHARAENPAMALGAYQELLLTNRQFAFARVLDGKAVVAVLNNDDAPARLDMGLPVPAETCEDLLDSGAAVRIENGRLIAELGPNQGTLIRL